ncbi:MAG: hypothetical protein E6L07_03290 [Verrucomicrobia bacterium]|nr:MAG: hypothetical protein E6L07_03290 [Verrucomicrobiota bacterium]
MKTKLVKRIMAPLVVACALLTMVATTATGQGTQGGRLQGTWEMRITLTDCAGHVIRSFPSLIEFVAGGTVVESNAGTPQALKTPGEGVWRHTTDNNYAFRFKFFTFNPQNVFTGWTIIAGETTVDSTGDANTGSATVKVYDPNGNLLVPIVFMQPAAQRCSFFHSGDVL